MFGVSFTCEPNQTEVSSRYMLVVWSARAFAIIARTMRVGMPERTGSRGGVFVEERRGGRSLHWFRRHVERMLDGGMRIVEVNCRRISRSTVM